MLSLHEILSRGRFIFSKSTERLRSYELVNGKRSVKEIAKIINRRENNVYRDLQKPLNMGLIRPVVGKAGDALKKERSPVYEKDPVAAEIPSDYFTNPEFALPAAGIVVPVKSGKSALEQKGPRPLLDFPSGGQVADISKKGEDQTFEFKRQGTEPRTVIREVGAMLNTSMGGIILYGIADDGTIEGAGITRQDLDPALQNSARNTISPPPVIELMAVDVMGTEIIAVRVPPWNRHDVYEYEGRVTIRKGTAVFRATPDESKRLHEGKYVV